MIFNLLSKSFQSLKTSLSASVNFRLFSRTTPKKGLEEFFENGQAFPIYEQEKKIPIGKILRHLHFCITIVLIV
jgi:hypothetical protein